MNTLPEPEDDPLIHQTKTLFSVFVVEVLSIQISSKGKIRQIVTVDLDPLE